MITYQSRTGKTVTARIVTERENLADHNVMSPCYEFELTLEGFGRINVQRLEDGLFVESGTRMRDGRRLQLKVPASPEAAALYAEYVEEMTRRLNASIKLADDAEAHRARVYRAMAE